MGLDVAEAGHFKTVGLAVFGESIPLFHDVSLPFHQLSIDLLQVGETFDVLGWQAHVCGYATTSPR